MTFENPQPKEGINTSRTHPLKEFATLIIGALIGVAILLAILSWSGEFLARLIPFSTEVALAEQFDPPDEQDSHHDSPTELAQRINQAMPLNDEYRIVVRYRDEDVINAFATLGGNVLLFRGLLDKLPHENALAMLLAHEIAHIQHRDPIVGLGKGVLIQFGMSMVFGQTPAVDNVLGQAGLLHSFQYTREMERAADKAALETVAKMYGHINGAGDLFEILAAESAESGSAELPEFLRTHPTDEHRIQQIEDLSRDNNWPTQGKLSKLPDWFAQPSFTKSTETKS